MKRCAQYWIVHVSDCSFEENPMKNAFIGGLVVALVIAFAAHFDFLTLNIGVLKDTVVKGETARAASSTVNVHVSNGAVRSIDDVRLLPVGAVVTFTNEVGQVCRATNTEHAVVGVILNHRLKTIFELGRHKGWVIPTQVVDGLTCLKVSDSAKRPTFDVPPVYDEHYVCAQLTEDEVKFLGKEEYIITAKVFPKQIWVLKPKGGYTGPDLEIKIPREVKNPKMPLKANPKKPAPESTPAPAPDPDPAPAPEPTPAPAPAPEPTPELETQD